MIGIEGGRSGCSALYPTDASHPCKRTLSQDILKSKGSYVKKAFDEAYMKRRIRKKTRYSDNINRRGRVPVI